MFHLLMMMVNDMQPFQITITNKTQLDCNLNCSCSVSWLSHNCDMYNIIPDVLAIGNDSWFAYYMPNRIVITMCVLL